MSYKIYTHKPTIPKYFKAMQFHKDDVKSVDEICDFVRDNVPGFAGYVNDTVNCYFILENKVFEKGRACIKVNDGDYVIITKAPMYDIPYIVAYSEKMFNDIFVELQEA